MTRAPRWIAGIAAALALTLAALWALLHAWLPSDEELAAQIGAHFEHSLGIGLTVGAAHWSLRPVPVIVLSELSTQQRRPITVRRMVLRPKLTALWRREIAFDSVEIEGAVLPRASVRAFRDRTEPDALRRASASGGWQPAAVPIARLRFSDVVWIDRREIALAYDGDIDFDADWLPRSAEVRRPGVSPMARLRLEREGQREEEGARRWRTQIDIGGGSWSGVSTLERIQNGWLRLGGRLEARDVDIQALVRSLGRGTPLAGKFAGQTELRAEGTHVAELVRSLHTRTRFSVRPAELMHLDLAQMARSAGTRRSGRTALDEFSGTVDTQASDDGVLLTYSELKARSGLLSASGNLRLFNRKLDGELAVDLVDGVAGLPFKLGGTVDKPELSLTGGALAGAAIGSAVLPGVGTAIGARLGQRLERLLDGDDPPARKAQPRRGARAP